jgi:hypothetical protein
MADDSQRQDYEKGKNKEHSGGSLEGARGGTAHSESGTGPTGSSRLYPKGKGNHFRTDWNPQKLPASTYGICGV